MRKQTLRFTFALTGALLAWAALLLQYYLIIHNYESIWIFQTIKFLFYFTILGNILVALAFSAQLVKNKSQEKFFSSPVVLTGIAVYITLVGLGYAVLLRALWEFKGWHAVANELLHTVNPIMFVLFWILFVEKTSLAVKVLAKWILFPVGYIVLVLTRGAIIHQYPYPFVDVKYLGYQTVLLNIGGLLIAFVIISLIFIWLNNAMVRKPQRLDATF